MRHRPLFIVAGSLLGLGIACSSSSTPSSSTPSTTNTATLHSGTFILPQSLADVAEVEASSVLFPASAYSQLSKYVAGNILLSDRQTPGSPGVNPQGFIRTVVSVTQSGSQVTVATTPATIADAMDANVSQTFEIPQATMNSPTPQGEPLHLQGGVVINPSSVGLKLLDYSGTTLFGTLGNLTLPNGAGTAHYVAAATVTKGTISFTPQLQLDFTTGRADNILSGGPLVKTANIVATGDLKGELDVAAELTLTSQLTNFSFEKLLGAPIQGDSNTISIVHQVYNLPSVPLPIGINIPASATLDVTVTCNFSFGGDLEVTIGGVVDATAKLGFTVASNKVTPTFGHTLSTMEVGPTFNNSGALAMNCTAESEVKLTLFDGLAGDIGVQVYAGAGLGLGCGNGTSSVQSATVNGVLEAGVRGVASYSVNVLGGLLQESGECALFDQRTTFPPISHSFNLPNGVDCMSSSDSYAVPAPPKIAPCIPMALDAGMEAGPMCNHPLAPIVPQTTTTLSCNAGYTLIDCPASAGSADGGGFQACALQLDSGLTSVCCGSGACPNATDQCVPCGGGMGYNCVPQGCPSPSICATSG